MLGSAVVQEAVSRGVSFALARLEEKVSQGHLIWRLEMAASELDLALERSAKLPITDVSLLQRRKMIKRSYVEAMELLDKHKQQAVPAGQEQISQGVKRPRWIFWAKDMAITPFAGLSTDDVRRFEWYADRAGKFMRDVESGCSLHHYTFCSPMVRHLLEGKTLRYYLKQENLERDFFIWPMRSDERGVEVLLRYSYEDSAQAEKAFQLWLILRLSESTDIVGVAMKSLQLLLASGFKLAAESAMGELTLLSNLQDIADSYAPPWVGIQEQLISHTQLVRPDPACCKGSRHGLYANNNNVSPELADLFPEQVILLVFQCYISALESSTRRRSPPLVLTTAGFAPHFSIGAPDSFALETIRDAKELRDVSIQQTVETVKSRAINCFLCQPDLTQYEILCYSKHGAAWFDLEVENTSTEREDVPKTRRRCNIRGSTRRSSRGN